MTLLNALIMILFRFINTDRVGMRVRAWLKDFSQDVSDAEILFKLILERFKAYLAFFDGLFIYERDPEMWHNLIRTELYTFQSYKLVSAGREPSLSQQSSDILNQGEVQVEIAVIDAMDEQDLHKKLRSLASKSDARSVATSEYILGILRQKFNHIPHGPAM